MPYTICKSFRFEAAHRLPSWPETHQCYRLHGHSYEVRLYLRADDLAPNGAVIDFGDLHVFRIFILERCDHRYLNDVFDFEPTAEHLARMFFEIATRYWSLVHAVRVYETADCYAEYKES